MRLVRVDAGRSRPAARRRDRRLRRRRWATRPTCWQARRGYIAAHVRRRGFRAVASLDRRGRACSASATATSAPGQWWHDQVRGALRRDARQALADRLLRGGRAARPPARAGARPGRRASCAPCSAWPSAKTTLLSTPEADEQTSRAWRLYRRFGFVDVLRHFPFPGDERPFAVLGRDLPLPARAGRRARPGSAVIRRGCPGAAGRPGRAQICYPLTGGAARAGLVVATVVLGFLLVGRRTRCATRGAADGAGAGRGGRRRRARWSRRVGVATGFPFGGYDYSGDARAAAGSACRWSSRSPGPGWPGRPGWPRRLRLRPRRRPAGPGACRRRRLRRWPPGTCSSTRRWWPRGTGAGGTRPGAARPARHPGHQLPRLAASSAVLMMARCAARRAGRGRHRRRTPRCSRSTCGRTTPRCWPTRSSSACPPRRLGRGSAWALVAVPLAVTLVRRTADGPAGRTVRPRWHGRRAVRGRRADRAHLRQRAGCCAARRPAGPLWTEPVAVLLPLRDEADRVARACARCSPSGACPSCGSLVLDDGSTDGTADVVRGVAGGDPRVTLLAGAPRRRAGWASRTPASSSPTRADRRRRPGLRRRRRGARPGRGRGRAWPTAARPVRPAVSAVSADLVAAAPAERLVQPLLQWSWLTFLPLRAMERSPRPSLAAAGGQFLLVTPGRLRPGRRARGGRDRGAGGHRAGPGGQARRRPDRAGRRLAAGRLPDVRRPGRSCATATPSRSGPPSAHPAAAAAVRAAARCSYTAPAGRRGAGAGAPVAGSPAGTARRRRAGSLSRPGATGGAGLARRAGPPGVGRAPRLADVRSYRLRRRGAAGLEGPPVG